MRFYVQRYLTAVVAGIALLLVAMPVQRAFAAVGGIAAGPAAGLWVRAEQERIREHLQKVEADLRGRDVSGLSASQQAGRRRALNGLAAYWKLGIFPRNEDFPGVRVPYFRDHHGTLCAMAFLIAQSGSTGIVEAVAATKNNAYIEDLKTDPTLRRWLHDNGLTALEASRIQPQYGFEQSQAWTSDWSLTTLLTATTLDGSSLFLNRRRVGSNKGRNRAVFGMAAGGLSILMGAPHLGDEDTNNKGIAAWNTVLGVVTLAVGASRYQQNRRHNIAAPEKSEPPRTSFDKSGPACISGDTAKYAAFFARTQTDETAGAELLTPRVEWEAGFGIGGGGVRLRTHF